LLVSIQSTNYWLYLKERELGSAMPSSSEPQAINDLMEADGPLCCYFEPRVFEAIKEACLLPEEYHGMDVAEAHKQHLIDFGRG